MIVTNTMCVATHNRFDIYIMYLWKSIECMLVLSYNGRIFGKPDPKISTGYPHYLWERGEHFQGERTFFGRIGIMWWGALKIVKLRGATARPIYQIYDLS